MAILEFNYEMFSVRLRSYIARIRTKKETLKELLSIKKIQK